MPHIHDKIDFTSTVFVVFDKKVLLRMHDKYNFWTGPGGHIELDEDPNQAAIREVKEEVGLDIELIDVSRNRECLAVPPGMKILIPPAYLNIHEVVPGHRHVDMIYFAKARNFDVKVGGEDRSDIWDWFSKEQLQTHPELRDEIRYYGEMAIEAVS